MTIAEKLILIAENQKKIYDAGYAKGKAESAPPKIISFYAGLNDHEAKEGMTWGEWCESEYNYESYNIDESGRVRWGNLMLADFDGEFVSASDVIVADGSYSWYS